MVDSPDVLAGITLDTMVVTNNPGQPPTVGKASAVAATDVVLLVQSTVTGAQVLAALVPLQPTGLTVNGPAADSMVVSWAADPNVTSYALAMSADAGATWAPLTIAPTEAAGVISTPVSGVPTGATVAFQLIGSNVGGASPAAVLLGIMTEPGEPVGLAASAITQTSLVLTWPAAVDATSSTLEMSHAGANAWTPIQSPVSPCTVGQLTVGTAYDFRLTDFDAAGPGTPEVLAGVSTLAASLVASDIAAGSITLTWIPPSVPFIGPYYIQTTGPGMAAHGGWATRANAPKGATSCVVPLPAGSYDVQVTAFNGTGNYVLVGTLTDIATLGYVAPPAGGGGGGGPPPPPPPPPGPPAPPAVPWPASPAGSVGVRLATNYGATAAPAGSTYQVFHALKQGDIPAGQIAVVQSGGVTVPIQQCDNRVVWPDGSLKCGVFNWTHPNAIPANGSDLISFVGIGGTWNNSGGPSISEITAHDYKMQVTTAFKGSGSGQILGNTLTLSSISFGTFAIGDVLMDKGTSGGIPEARIVGNTLYVVPVNGTSRLYVGSLIQDTGPSFSGSIAINGTTGTLGYVLKGQIMVGSVLVEGAPGTTVTSIDTITGNGPVLYSISAPQYISNDVGVTDTTSGAAAIVNYCYGNFLQIGRVSSGTPLQIGDALTGANTTTIVGSITGAALTVTGTPPSPALTQGEWIVTGASILTYITAVHSSTSYTVADSQTVAPGTTMTVNAVRPGTTITGVLALATQGTFTVNNSQTRSIATTTVAGVLPGTQITAFMGYTNPFVGTTTGIETPGTLAAYTINNSQTIGLEGMSVPGILPGTTITAGSGLSFTVNNAQWFQPGDAIVSQYASPITYTLSANNEIALAARMTKVRAGPAKTTIKLWGDFRNGTLETSPPHGQLWGKFWISATADGIRVEDEIYCNKIATSSALQYIESYSLLDGDTVLFTQTNRFILCTLNKIATYDQDGNEYFSGAANLSKVVWAFPKPVLTDPTTTGLYDACVAWWYKWSDAQIAAFPAVPVANYLPAGLNNYAQTTGFIDGEGTHSFTRPMMESSVQTMLSGRYDLLRFDRMIALGAWSQMMLWVADAPTGFPPVCTDITYAGLAAPNVSLTMSGSATHSFPILGGNLAGTTSSTSHAGLWWWGQYLFTGSEQALENIQEQAIGAYTANNPAPGTAQGTNPKFNGNQYWGAFCHCEQSRGVGWQIRNQSDAHWVTPDTHPVKPYVGQLITNTWNACADMLTQFGPPGPNPGPPAGSDWASLAWWYESATLPVDSPWMGNFKAYGICMDVRRGHIPLTHGAANFVVTHQLGAMKDGNAFNASSAYRLTAFTTGGPNGGPNPPNIAPGQQMCTSWDQVWGMQDVTAPPGNSISGACNPLIPFGSYGSPILSGVHNNNILGVNQASYPPNSDFAIDCYTNISLIAGHIAYMSGMDAVSGPSGTGYATWVINYLTPSVDGSTAATEAAWGRFGSASMRIRSPA